mmetsp:Transcript_69042/g.124482  ORF Transcript_69042/g.124482 Transcript_69042/m.124482 type:complete len:108 (+) Transcript_69042:235-558(+)
MKSPDCFCTPALTFLVGRIQECKLMLAERTPAIRTGSLAVMLAEKVGPVPEIGIAGQMWHRTLSSRKIWPTHLPRLGRQGLADGIVKTGSGLKIGKQEQGQHEALEP